MGKKLIITEKPSVAREFARVLGVSGKHQGYIDNDEYIITWCVGHLVEMVYPEQYDIRYKKWRLEDLPFLPENYKYDIIKKVKDQYEVVHGFLNSPEVDVVYWAGDSGKEGQTIEENIRHFGGVRSGMTELRVWIDSQTDDEIRRGIKEAKPMSDYANLGKSGVMRAIEDYALGINFSRALSVKYGTMINKAASTKSYTAIAVGRVMTCVLGMVVNREREIRNFVETPFYRVIASFAGDGIEAEWHVDEESRYNGSPVLYKDNGFKEEKDAKALIAYLKSSDGLVPDQGAAVGIVESIEKSKSRKKPPFLFNLAELQAECSKLFKLSPDQTLEVAQALYERKMTTYPRTDARVLTAAVAKEITKNLNGIRGFAPATAAVDKILNEGLYKSIGKSQYTDDSKVTDHYAIIPTGVISGYSGLTDIQKKVYELIVRRFLSIFYPPAEYLQIKIAIRIKTEQFASSVKMLTSPGYLEIAGSGKGDRNADSGRQSGDKDGEGEEESATVKQATVDALSKLKKGSVVVPTGYDIKPGKTSPPKRYTSGTMILAMENAGNLIDDEELRAQIKNCGIGTSATRAEIIKKLVTIGYLNLNKKTQVLTPGGIGEMIYEAVKLTQPSLLNPQMSASWEKGLDEITRGIVDVRDYRSKLEEYIRKGTLNISQKDLSVQIANEIEKLVGDAGLVQMPRRNLGIACPVCGGELTTTSFGYGCTNYRRKEMPCSFSVGKIAGLRLDEEDFRELVEQGKTRKIRGFKSKAGKTFEASLRLEKNEGGECRVAFEFDNSHPQSKIEDLRCPICGGRVMKSDSGFTCENYRKGDSNADSNVADGGGKDCIFSIGSVMGRTLTENEVCELIKNGATPLIRGFVTDKGETFDARIGFKTAADGSITGMRFIRG